MQELLSGRTRLSGFNNSWKSVDFKQMAMVVKDRVMPTSASGRVVELEHIESGTGRLLGDADLRQSASLKTRFKKDDVLFGKLRSYLRKYWLADRDGFCSTEIWALRSLPGTCSEFLRYVVELESFVEAASTAYGTHMPRADWTVVSRLELAVPDEEEQRAIAALLRDADDEIAALERRLDSARAIKQGMMQELLTGRTRLTEEVAA
jgi:type I restriction enzyme, S subunit